MWALKTALALALIALPILIGVLIEPLIAKDGIMYWVSVCYILGVLTGVSFCVALRLLKNK